MKTQRIYIDTSVFGGCFDSEFAQWSNGPLKDIELGLFKGVVSDIVTAEIIRAPEYVRTAFDRFLSWDSEIVSTDNEETTTLVSEYLKHDILPKKFSNDMLHIATATVAEVDLLVSWNFKHIERHDKIIRFNAVNIEHGYRPLSIYSPREVTSYEKD